jgi:hypothetical protein
MTPGDTLIEIIPDGSARASSELAGVLDPGSALRFGRDDRGGACPR